MATVRLQTPPSSGHEITKVSGSKVLVGDVELDHVGDVRLVGEPGGVWKLQITVNVDPAQLFQPAGEHGARVEVKNVFTCDTTAVASELIGKVRGTQGRRTDL